MPFLLAWLAQGRSALNRVDRKMTPLSNELWFSSPKRLIRISYLNDQGITVDDAHDRKNFKFAGQSLAEIWSDVTIDGYPTVAQYIDPSKSMGNHLSTPLEEAIKEED